MRPAAIEEAVAAFGEVMSLGPDYKEDLRAAWICLLRARLILSMRVPHAR